MADFIVTTIDDTMADDGVTSLREAIALADASAGADTITFDAGLSGQTITLVAGEFVLTSDVTIDGDIDGDDVADITVSGNNVSRVFNATSGASTLDALIITDGNSSFFGGDGGGSGAGLSISGGATVNLINSTLSSCYSDVGDAGISNSGTLTIANSTISDNATYFSGGGIGNSGTLTINSSTLSGNGAGYSGGGIFNRGILTISNSTLSGNILKAEYFAGGGGIYNSGTATITNSTISGNSVGRLYGGGVYNIGTLTLTNSTLSGNSAVLGGGIQNRGTAVLTNSTLSGNTASTGGGMYNWGNTIVVNSIVLGNNGGNVQGNFDTLTATNSLIGADGETAADVFADLASNGGGLLADNGGPVLTIALRADPLNPALDAGDDAAAPATDSRGTLRADTLNVDNNGLNISDLGAFELVSAQSGSNGPDTITGTALAEILTGNGGNDVIYGLGGDDTINGNFGNDQLFGGVGSDFLSGGAGADWLEGRTHNDELRGEGGNDVLLGGRGEDLLLGGDQNDQLFGDDGDDRLRGGDGNDRITGGFGADLLFGGADADTFVYLSADDSLTGAGADRIVDFVQGEDLLGFRYVSPEIFDFIGTSILSGDGPEIRIVETANGNTSIFADVDGDATADMRVVVIGVTGLSESDFLL